MNILVYNDDRYRRLPRDLPWDDHIDLRSRNEGRCPRIPVEQDLHTRESVGIGDVEAQAERAMANIAMLLEEAGGELADIVKVVVYLTDVRYREPVYRVMGRWLKGVFPVSTGLVVTALARPEWVVEIDATAVVPDERA